MSKTIQNLTFTKKGNVYTVTFNLIGINPNKKVKVKEIDGEYVISLMQFGRGFTELGKQEIGEMILEEFKRKKQGE